MGKSVNRTAHFADHKVVRGTRNNEMYLESNVRCERLVNSPFFHFRRQLNGKEGKTYGIRKVEYRE